MSKKTKPTAPPELQLALLDTLDGHADSLQSTEGGAPTSFLVVRAGVTGYTKDGKHGTITVTQDSINSIVDSFSIKARDTVVDYEHQSLSQNEAPAAGWITALQAVPEGIVATVNWCKRAIEYFEAREYRYHSPVLLMDADANITSLHSVALTNHPALHGMAPLVATDTTDANKETKMPKDQTIEPSVGTPTTTEALSDATVLPVEPVVEPQVIEPVQTLTDGPAQATPTIVAPVADPALDALTQIAKTAGVTLAVLTDATVDVGATAVAVELALTDALNSKATLTTLLTEFSCSDVAALRVHINGLVPAQELADTKATLAARDARDAVALALNDGKLMAAQQGWATEYALRDPKGFKAFTDGAPRVTPLKAAFIDAGTPPASMETAHRFSDAESLILRRCGLQASEIAALEAGKQ